jgi:hypothetical protein
MIELLAVIFRFCPSDGVFFYWTITVIKTVRGNENSIWKGKCPPLFPKGESKTEFPETHPPEGQCPQKGGRNYLNKNRAF